MHYDADKELRIRKNLYREVFTVLDTDFTNALNPTQLEELGLFVSGKSWSTDEVTKFMMDHDEDYDGFLRFDEFVKFCETHLLPDIDELPDLIQEFLHVSERQLHRREDMWKTRAKRVDLFSRWGFPPGFLFFLSLLFYLMDEGALESMETHLSLQAFLITSGLYPTLSIILAFFLLRGFQAYTEWQQSRNVSAEASQESLSLAPTPGSCLAAGGVGAYTSSGLSSDGATPNDPEPTSHAEDINSQVDPEFSIAMEMQTTYVV